jgi:hypothetical protein
MEESLYFIFWAALSLWMLGQVWFGQIVVYPLFAKVDEADYIAYHRFYSSRLPLVVILPGFANFLLPLPLAWFGPAVPPWMSAVKNDSTIAELIRYNWPRTASMTIQALVTAMMLDHVLEAT